MKCLFCDGFMERRLVSYTIDRKGYHLFIEKVPGYVCTQCGERQFSEKAVVAIQSMIVGLEEKLKKVNVAA